MTGFDITLGAVNAFVGVNLDALLVIYIKINKLGDRKSVGSMSSNSSGAQRLRGEKNVLERTSLIVNAKVWTQYTSNTRDGDVM